MLNTYQPDMQLASHPAHSAQPNLGIQIRPSAAPKITPRPRRRRHGLGYKQLVAAAVTAAAPAAAAAGRLSPGARPSLHPRAIVGESHKQAGLSLIPPCLPQCASPRRWSIAGCHWLAQGTERR